MMAMFCAVWALVLAVACRRLDRPVDGPAWVFALLSVGCCWLPYPWGFWR
jgi:hypothetical protein